MRENGLAGFTRRKRRDLTKPDAGAAKVPDLIQRDFTAPMTGRGGQDHASAHRNALRRLNIRQSTSRTGSCLDRAAAESFFATIKAEIGVASWPDRASARRDIENWITAYNQRRLHSSPGYQTPLEA